MSDEWVRVEGIVIGIAIMSLGFYLTGCTPKKDMDELKSELEQAKLDLQVITASSGHNHALALACKAELESVHVTLEKTCALADRYLHKTTEYPFIGTRELTEMPCNTSIPIQVGIHEVDIKNKWAYIGYVVGDEQRFTDPLWWDNESSHSDRNTIRIRVPGKVEEVIFLTVHACESKDMCQMSCFAFELPTTHALACNSGTIPENF